MGDSINVDWGLAQDQANTLGSIGQTAQQSQLAGFDIGQKQAQASALQNYDVDNPQSAASTTQALVRANAIPTASALTDLSKARYIVNEFPGAIAKAHQQMAAEDAQSSQPGAQGGQAATPSGTPASGGAPAPTPGNFQVDPQNTYDIMRLAKNATGDLLSTPLIDRPAEAAKVKATMLARGVPEPAIDSAMADLSDEGLQSLNAHYGAVVNHLSTVPGVKAAAPTATTTTGPDGVPEVSTTQAPLPNHVNPYPAAPSPQAAGGGAPASGAVTTGAGAPTPYEQTKDNLYHPSNDWAKNYLQHPATIAYNKWAQSVGIPAVADLEPTAMGLEGPNIAHQAQLDYQIPQALAEKATQTAPELINGVEHEVPALTKLQEINNPEFRAAGVGVGLSPEQQAYQSTAGSEKAAAPYRTQVITGAHGEPVTMTGEGVYNQGQQNGGLVARGPAPAAQGFANEQAGQAADMLKPDLNARAQANDQAGNAARALSFLEANQLNASAPIKQKAAEYLRVAGVPGAENFAGDLASYEALAKGQLVAGAHDMFPGRITDNDTQLYNKVVPGLTTPNDAAKVAWGLVAAKAHRQAAIEDFKAGYQGEAQPGVISNAWAAKQGGQSLFADPVWKSITIGGKPALQTVTNPKTGNPVLIFGAGTGHPFQVR